ncbi:alpha/beta hydrolase [Salinarimonas sp. NSM]|uniref:alpha/beta hydrolase n=1 Tax=Salinarimonas sp. NSM TaxID=3458003 RepID=UPI00403594A1
MSDLHPNLRAWLDQLNPLVAQQRAQGIEATPQMVRDSLAGLTATFVTEQPEMATRDLEADLGDHSLRLRVYDPSPDSLPGQALPVLLFFHGGGHMAGSVAVYDPIARKLAKASGWLVVSVDYRLSPEAPYPAGLEDCLAVTRTIWRILDQHQIPVLHRLALAGDSGGATFAAAVSQALADDPDHAIEAQVLIYPSLDYTMSWPSVREHGEGYLLEAQRIQWYFDHYFQHGEDRRAASPLHQPLPATMPRTLVITAGFCPLHDEGAAYAEQLQQARHGCELHNYPDMIHAYLNLENLVPEACADTYQRIGAFLLRG